MGIQRKLYLLAKAKKEPVPVSDNFSEDLQDWTELLGSGLVIRRLDKLVITREGKSVLRWLPSFLNEGLKEERASIAAWLRDHALHEGDEVVAHALREKSRSIERRDYIPHRSYTKPK